jgi:mycothiol synthase
MFQLRVQTRADDALVTVARHLLDHALDPTLRDDRFDTTWVSEANDGNRFFAATAIGDEHPVGYVGGLVDRGRLQLDALVSPHSRWPESTVFDALLGAVTRAALATSPATFDTIEVWGKPAHPWHGAVAEDHGFRPTRSLQQMRCRLPLDVDTLETRAFEPGTDDAALIAVNNRAFLGHPDQGGWTTETLVARMNEPWFDPQGVRIFESEGRIAGFCLTKIHERPALGEIYAIGIDPDFHGRGLGAPMTAAGLEWLAERGLEVGMLYVETDNVPAVRTYERLGFETVRVDRAWAR